jgi:hypothetical protein
MYPDETACALRAYARCPTVWPITGLNDTDHAARATCRGSPPAQPFAMPTPRSVMTSAVERDPLQRANKVGMHGQPGCTGRS